jgi:large subunit ribosomal protein L22
MIQATATARFLRGSPQKAGLVVDLIRGKRAADALAILQRTNKAVSKDVEKVLRSAIANAQQRALGEAKRIDEDDLVVIAAVANQGPSFKRIRPAPMGRAYRVIHRTTHLTIGVAEKASAEGGEEG